MNRIRHPGNEWLSEFGALTYAVVTVAALPITARATVEVNVTRVGFPTLQQGDVCRSGAWVPVIIDIALVDQLSFDGSIRIGQLDIDGDECYDRVGVHLRAEAGASRRLFLYTVANPQPSHGAISVELFDEEGEAVQVLSQGVLTFQAQPAKEVSVIHDDDILILSLSTGAIGRVQDLVAPDQQDMYRRAVRVGHMSPLDLPELWLGLEAVDYIVWDDARPEELTERQIEALIEWVRQGGTLLIAASRSAGSLVLTDAIRQVLPVDIGELIVVDNLPEARRTLLGAAGEDQKSRGEEEKLWWQVPFDAPVPLVRCTLRNGAKRVSGAVGGSLDIIARRGVGRGQVIFSGVILKDLFSGPGSATGFFRELFHLGLVSSDEHGRPTPETLFPRVVSAIGFSTWSSMYVLAAFAFSAVYLLCATFGTWGFLGRRGWRHHSWSAFAAVALLASLFSVLGVNFVHGFGETLHQVSIMDLDGGMSYGHATAFFGLKTGTDRQLDLWLPPDRLAASEPDVTDCFLRSIPAAGGATEASTSFADPGEYRLVPASAVVENVRIRATLKRFEGRWDGSVGGTLTGEITADNVRILDGSYVVNDLGVDLVDCWLFHTTRDFSRDVGVRSDAIYVYRIGTVPSDGRRMELAPRCYGKEGEEKLSQILDRSRLAAIQLRWGKEVRSVLTGGATGQERNALLLASTVGEYNPKEDAGMGATFFGLTSWSRDRLRQLDLREHFRPDSVVLIGFAEDPGPIRLFRRVADRPYRMLKPDPDNSWTMYRIRLPVTLVRSQPKDELEEILDDKIR